MRQIRDAIRTSGVVPSASAVARTFPTRVVALSSRRQALPVGKIGIWKEGRKLIASTQASNGRRLYVELRSGRIGPHNLGSLASPL